MLDSIIECVTRNYAAGTDNSNQYVAGEVADYIVTNYPGSDWTEVYEAARRWLA